MQDVGYLDKRVSSDLCLRTYLIESRPTRLDLRETSWRSTRILALIINPRPGVDSPIIQIPMQESMIEHLLAKIDKIAPRRDSKNR